MSESKVYNNVAREDNAPATLLEQLVESRLENKMERGFNRILREMQANNAEIKSEIDKLDRKIDKVESKVDKLEIELKSEIKRVETDLSAKIDKVETELKSEIKRVETDLSAKIDKVETDLSAKIDKVETELKSEIKRVDSKVSRANILSATALTLITLIIGAIISWVINNHLKMN